ncbi:MAG TPA: phosphatase PAP2 family protein [Flavisolibacter sp.]|jgi:undecaprenyl-diphosphatase|nr:phosphatase PAP2 family protein [Flavisolibacter sp.]
MYHPALTISLWQRIEEWDRAMFLVLNNKLSNPVFDSVLPFFRDSVFWAPLYLFILAFAVLNWGSKGLWWVLFFVATVAIADLLGTYAFKETIRRIRPCNNPALIDHLRLVLKRCPGGYSFLSNHAANHFGLATFMVLTLRGVWQRWIWLAYAWAILISFAQVYVGVHYPLDIAGGALLGMVAGYVTASLYHYNFGRLNYVN